MAKARCAGAAANKHNPVIATREQRDARENMRGRIADSFAFVRF
jgi:hypothetical protein